MSLETQIIEDDRQVVARLIGEAGVAQTIDLEDIVNRLRQVGPRTLVLDLSRMTFISSMGLGTLVSLRRDVMAGGGKFVLHSPSPTIMDVLHKARLDKVFTITVEETAA